MPGLPADLSKRCRNTLLQCSEFDSHAALQAVFVTDELRPFRNELPEAASKDERVAKCTDYLLERRRIDSLPVLAIFLTTLHSRYMPGNALRDDLGALAKEVEAVLTSPSLNPTHVTSQINTAPQPPKHLVQRPRELEATLDLLLAENRDTPVALVTALQGGGGFGKTTLAQAICHDGRVQDTFPDGVLWMTPGENPSLIDLVKDQIELLTGERPGFSDINLVAKQLSDLLEERRVLIVLDDVWDDLHVRPFMRGGMHCARLVTTRRQDVAARLRAQVVDVDQMTNDEGARLLVAWLDEPVPEVGPFRELAKEMGEWPLMLELAGAYLRESMIIDNEPLNVALTGLHKRLTHRGFTAFDRTDQGQRNRAISISLELSLYRLGEWRQRYCELAVFPAGIDVPIAAIQKLWGATAGLNDLDTEDALKAMRRLSLFSHQDPEAESVRLHDVIHAYLRQTSDDLLGKHCQLLDSYNVDKWTDLPCDEPYLWNHLGYHLVEVQRESELRPLLLDFYWLQAKLNATDVNSLIADFNRLPADKPLRLARDAIRLSAHVLIRDKTQLAGHLLGRLGGFLGPHGPLLTSEKEAEIDALLSQARRFRSVSWLRPLTRSLTSPGTPLVLTLEGHTAEINAVALTPGEDWIVSASSDKTLKVWDLDSGLEVHTLYGHSDKVNAVVSTPEGQKAVSASDDGTLRVWDLGRGVELCTLAGHAGPVLDVAVTSDGKSVVSASADNSLRLWDLASGEEIRTLWSHSREVVAVAVTRDGLRAVSISEDSIIKIWDLANGDEILAVSLPAHYFKVFAMVLDRDEWRIVLATDEGLDVWDLKSGRAVIPPAFFADSSREFVTDVALTRDGTRVLISSRDNTVKMYDLETGMPMGKLVGHTHWVNAVAVTEDGHMAVSASADGTIKVWDLESGMDDDRRHHEEKVLAHVRQTDFDHWCSLGSSAHDYLLSLRRWTDVQEQFEHRDAVMSMVTTPEVMTPDGTKLVSASRDGTLKLWSLEYGTELRTLKGHRGGVTSVAVTADGRRAVSTGENGAVKVWYLPSGLEVETLWERSETVWSVGLSADGRWAVTAGPDETVGVWSLVLGIKIRTLSGHKDQVYGVAVTPDGQRVVSASADHTLKVWDPQSGDEIFTLSGHTGLVRNVVVTADGLRAVSASFDKTLKVWDLETGTELRTLTGHISVVNAVSVTPDGRWAASASSDKSLKLWDLKTGEAVASFVGDEAFWACAIAPDGLTVAGGTSLGKIHFLRLETMD